jgi:N-acetylneuraminate epimerase
MQHLLYVTIFMLLTTTLSAENPITGKQLPNLPDKHGWAGMYAGVSHDTLIVAGGANFPVRPLTEGGTKTWTDKIFALEQPDGQWRDVGTLPQPLGYGLTVNYQERMILVGGSDAKQHHTTVLQLEYRDGRVTTDKLPDLPVPLANHVGALVGQSIYVVGGITEPTATATSAKVYALDLSQKQLNWAEIKGFPGAGRMLAMCGSHDNQLYVVGGVDLTKGADGTAKRVYLKDGYSYTPDQGWQKLPDLPRTIAAAPTPLAVDQAGMYLFGGDDGSQVGVPAQQHQGFLRTAWRFDWSKQQWSEFSALPVTRVTVPVTRWRDSWVIPSGEARPGIRSPEVWQLTWPQESK